MVAVWQVLANADLPARVPGADLRLLWASLALVAVIVLGVAVLVWLDRWRKRSAVPPLGVNEQLAHFRELYQRGDLSQEEFERIRASLASQLRHELDIPPAGPPKPPDAAAGPPGTES